MNVTIADFSVDPPRLSNAEARQHQCDVAGSHLALNAGGSVELDFEVADPEEVPEATLTITALVSKLGSSLGYSPIDVLLQGEVLVEGLTVPGGGDLPHDNVFAVPGHLLKPGTNTLEIRVSAKARSMLWLYRITLDPVHERGRSERARAAEAVRDSIFAFRTERHPAHSESSSWEPAPRLVFHIDRGEHSLPAQLSWRGEDGAESAVSFQSSMSDFYGCHRTGDGTTYEYRGRRVDGQECPQSVENSFHLHRFRTEEGWGGGWHPSHDLRLMVDDGGAPAERVAWRDQQGNSGVAVLQSASTDVEVTGVVASDEFSAAGETADNLLDESPEKWLAGYDTAWVDFTLARPTVITSYSLMSANDFPGRDPRNWTLHGSHDGRHWTPLDSRTGETFAGRFQTRKFSLGANTTAYRHYRLDITRNGDATEVQLAHVRFAGAPADQTFTGYYQRFNEGPIGYRGTALSAPTPPAFPAPRLAADLEAAAESLTATAQTLSDLAARLRDH
ncbi:discoidin domain-containing protein [Streptomyces sp. KM273126]|uniref:discoidin domain-containing protein n=1 Tax=Streptomyces sp. KM273126 TaxID=2545247 RepID=UPI00103BD79F|nr:discoidin domain-containing protein [Streptomyces sp. KM273126]MBA2813364.1 discoidin domain-containing protein [Streptomyces sp. KM273126]